jgi:hypothetical protein
MTAAAEAKPCALITTHTMSGTGGLRLHVRVFGQDRIGAIEFVGGAVKRSQAAFGSLLGPGFLDHFAEVSWYEGVAHVPQLEEPERFNRELAEFTRSVHA